MSMFGLCSRFFVFGNVTSEGNDDGQQIALPRHLREPLHSKNVEEIFIIHTYYIDISYIQYQYVHAL